MKLTVREQQIFDRMARRLLANPDVRRMGNYCQHGSVSCLDHCVAVARTSFWLSRRLGVPVETRSLLRGAMLHDFFLYDWHQPHDGHGLHGFTHPGTALRNASACFRLRPREQDIIAKHMWPLTVVPPRCREAYLVCLADKLCALKETLCRRRFKAH